MNWKIQFYTTKSGTMPVRDWLETLSDKRLYVSMRSKITKLAEEGWVLLRTKAMKPIKGKDENLYELKARDGRINVFFDKEGSAFVLLNAFYKSEQKRKIAEARRFLHDYLKKR